MNPTETKRASDSRALARRHGLWIVLLVVITGAMIPFAPAWIPTLVLTGLALFVLELAWPLMPLGVLLLLCDTVMPLELLPRVPVSRQAELNISDVLIIYLLVSALFSRIRRRTPPVPIAVPLVLFVAAAVFSGLGAIIFTQASFNNMGKELRPIIFLLICFPVVYRLAAGNSIKKLMDILVALSIFTAIVAFAQLVSGDRIGWFLTRARSLKTFGALAPAMLRVKPPGLILMHITFILVLARYLEGGKGAGRDLIALIIIGSGLLVSFHRYIFVTVILAAVILLAWMPERERRRAVVRLLGTGLVSLALCFVLIWKAPPTRRLAESLKTRIASLWELEALEQSDSIQERFTQYRDAVKSISVYPVWGVGLGNPFRTDVTPSGEERIDEDAELYLHNVYLMVQVKMGIIGTLLFLSICVCYLWWWVKIAFNPHGSLDPVVHKGAGVGFMMLLVTNMASATLISMMGAPVAGVLWGMTFVNARRKENESCAK